MGKFVNFDENAYFRLKFIKKKLLKKGFNCDYGDVVRHLFSNNYDSDEDKKEIDKYIQKEMKKESRKEDNKK